MEWYHYTFQAVPWYMQVGLGLTIGIIGVMIVETIVRYVNKGGQ